MSWWDDGREVLGDRPVDALKAAWRRALAARAERSLPLPTLAEALGAYAAAIRGADFVPGPVHLSLQRKGQPPLTFDGVADGDGGLREAFARGVGAMADAYREALDRPPTPLELAKTMEFIVGPAPATYLRDGGDSADWMSWRLVVDSPSPDAKASA